MRPVNLIPPEDRRGDRAPARTGSIPYVIVAGLAVALIAVTAVVMFGKQVSERESQLTSLEAQAAAASAQADALSPYVQFEELAAARDETVTSLAESRFDWERVMRELALVLPDNIWLTDAVAAAAPTESSATGADASITGPSMTLTGCGTNHEAVAGFVAALRDIDGVTRVGISSSERQDGGGTAAESGTEGGGVSDCRTDSMIAKFEIIIAFDGVVAVPAPAAAVPGAEAAPTAVPAGGEAE
jgi:Tfp pilus assembly protein PilN